MPRWPQPADARTTCGRPSACPQRHPPQSSLIHRSTLTEAVVSAKSWVGDHGQPRRRAPIHSQTRSASVHSLCPSSASGHRARKGLAPASTGCGFSGTWMICPHGPPMSHLPGILLQTSSLCYHWTRNIIPTWRFPVPAPHPPMGRVLEC